MSKLIVWCVVGAALAVLFLWYCQRGYFKTLGDVMQEYGDIPVEERIVALHAELVRRRSGTTLERKTIAVLIVMAMAALCGLLAYPS